MTKRNDSKSLEIEEPLHTRQETRTSQYWKVPAILTFLLVAGSIAALIHYYTSRTPRQCYECRWTTSPNGPALNDDPCGRDQRTDPNAHVKTCAPDQDHCGSLHISVSYVESSGRAESLEYAFVRDCFAQYPLPYGLKIGNAVHNYTATREGNVYSNVAGSGLNVTVVGQQCSAWNKCNAHEPNAEWRTALLDPITIFELAKDKGLGVWHTLEQLVKEAKNATASFL